MKTYYSKRIKEITGKPLTKTDGISPSHVKQALTKAELTIPQALFDYYSVAGKHWINKEHNQLLPIKELYLLDDHLVFMEENQLVAFWGIHKDDLTQENPIVWQGPNTKPREWYEEEYKLKQFIMAMWNWTLTEFQEPPE